MTEKLKYYPRQRYNILIASSADQYLLTQRSESLKVRISSPMTDIIENNFGGLCFVMPFKSNQDGNCLFCYQELTGNDEWVSWLKSIVMRFGGLCRRCRG